MSEKTKEVPQHVDATYAHTLVIYCDLLGFLRHYLLKSGHYSYSIATGSFLTISPHLTLPFLNIIGFGFMVNIKF